MLASAWRRTHRPRSDARVLGRRSAGAPDHSVEASSGDCPLMRWSSHRFRPLAGVPDIFRRACLVIFAPLSEYYPTPKRLQSSGSPTALPLLSRVFM
eukprot:2343779-Pyramimonas_sp.AAC.1